MLTIVVKWSEGLSNRVSNIIRRYVDNMSLLLIWLFRLLHFFRIPLVPYFSLYIWLYVLYSSA